MRRGIRVTSKPGGWEVVDGDEHDGFGCAVLSVGAALTGVGVR
jgi:hypothetical protein